MPSVSSIFFNVNSLTQGLTGIQQGGALGGSPTNLAGFSYFSSLNSADKSVGIVGGNRERVVLNTVGAFNHGELTAPHEPLAVAVYHIPGVKGEPLVVKSYGNKGGAKKADKSGTTKNMSRRYSFDCVYILLTYLKLIRVRPDNCLTTPWRCYA